MKKAKLTLRDVLEHIVFQAEKYEQVEITDKDLAVIKKALEGDMKL